MPSGKLTSSRLFKSEKAPFPIEVILETIFVALQPDINVLVFVSIMALQSSRESYTAFPLSTFKTSKFEHPEKGECPIFSTVSGITILVKDVQPLKASAPISIRPCGKTISLRFVHPEKASKSIFLTPLPITIFVKDVQYLNA